MKKMLKGFTLVEIMIVVAIIAILAAVAIPNFVKYRRNAQAASCIANLKQIQTAKEQWLMANGSLPANGIPDLVGDSNYIKKTPVCPAGGQYSLGDEGADPTCNKGTLLDQNDKAAWHVLNKDDVAGATPTPNQNP